MTMSSFPYYKSICAISVPILLYLVFLQFMLAINSMYLNLDFFPILKTLPLNYSFRLLTISIIIYIIGFSSTTLLSDPSVFTFFLLCLKLFFLIIFNYMHGIGGMYAWMQCLQKSDIMA